MKLEEGMYVRTPYGIRKILKIKKDEGYGIPRVKVIEFDRILDTIYKYDYDFYTDENVIKKSKASHNIIDLLEPMDLMYIDIYPDNCGGIVVPRIAETLNELEKWKERFSNGDCILKRIITREQIESMSYKVEVE